MDLMKIKLYIELFSMAMIVSLFYSIVVGIILGEWGSVGMLVAVAAFSGIIMWKWNDTFHQLLAKWGRKK
jgi:hypothetical protein